MALEYNNSHRTALGHVSWAGLTVGALFILGGLGAASGDGGEVVGAAAGAVAFGNFAFVFGAAALLLWLLAHSISYDRANPDVSGAEIRERKRREKAQRDL